MSKRGKHHRAQAVGILHRRHIKGDPQREALLEAERWNAHAARLIYHNRRAAGLTQKELSALVGTTQSVISRLEDADYAGHSLSMLRRIARALGLKLRLTMTAHPELGCDMAEKKATRPKAEN